MGFLFLALTVSSLAAQQKHALVMGNGNYASVTKLNNPVNDARDMEAALKAIGWTVELVIDGSQDQMESAAIRLKNRLSASKQSYGFLFYAGHGVQSNGENFLIPVDANIQSESFLRSRAVSVQALLDELNAAGNTLNIMVLDACRDNPFSWKRSSARGLQVIANQPADSIIVYATSAGNTAEDGTGRNGLFTTHLLNNLKTPGLSVRDLFDRTGADVRRASGGRQVPAIYSQFFDTAYLGSRPAGAAPAPVSASVPAPAPTPTPAPSPVSASGSQNMPANMIRINGRTFTMGSPLSEAGRIDNEAQHQVTVTGFYLGKYEVTQKEYEEVMGINPSRFKGQSLPVERVSWFDAVEYCNRRSQKEGLTPAYTISGSGNNRTVSWNRNANGYRLPTEAEWEYACRAGTAGPFSTGINITANQVNYNGNYPYNSNAKGTYREKTTAVGSFAANPWGFYDMHGNVWEWCWDWYGDYGSRTQTDPAGAASGTLRVFRGGSWFSLAAVARSAYRYYYAPTFQSYNLGFRVARS
ncbi:hypothetical protein FACS1894147_06700 [Spirochaetia bacterium]|nr:hypothetical protein FACS1894147_06700 [Spirochaetia bacterium]